MTPLGSIQFSNGATRAADTNPFAARYNATHPQMNFTTGSFQNALNAGNTAAAYQMLLQGGGVYQDAVRQAMGWDQNQFANFVNGVDANNPAAHRGIDPSTLQQYGATFATPTVGNPRNGGDIANAAQFNVGAGMGGYGPLATGGPNPNATTIGSLASGTMATAPTPGGGNPAVGPGGAIGGAIGGNVNPAGVNGGGANGPTGVGSIPGGQPNYPLDIGSYLNPMMQYAMQQGINTINNSAAAAGNLNSGNTMKELYNFGMGMGAQNFNNAANIAQGQQAFSYGVDNNDRNFFYNAQNNDRQFDLNALLGMGNLGLQGTAQQSANQRLLATLISQNMGAIGQAQSTGTIGASNAITQAIQQWLASAMSGR